MVRLLFVFILAFGFAGSADAVIVSDQGKILSVNSERSIRENILFLSLDEKQRDQAADRLRHFPRDIVLKVLRSEIKTEGAKLSESNLRAITEIGDVEALSELRNVGKRRNLGSHS